MKFAFITDLHIDKAYEYPYGIDPRANFQRILKAIAKGPAEQLIIGGDLCYRAPEVEIYEWIFEELAQFKMPFHIIAGNHDDPEMMSKIGGFEALMTEGELFYARKFKPFLAIFLDTSKGKVSKNQLAWMDRQLYQHKGPTVIFMHHPPMHAGVPVMDDNPKRAFQGKEAFLEILESTNRPIPIFTGHYHVEKTVSFKNVQLFITPSCFFQINQFKDDFKVDHHRIAYRLIELDGDSLKSSLHYIAGSRQMDS